MSEDDRSVIVRAVRELADRSDGVVVIHGVPGIPMTANSLLSTGPTAAPVVFTGAMRPYALRSSDALQNLSQALLAARLLDAGVYVVMSNQVERFPVGEIGDIGASGRPSI